MPELYGKPSKDELRAEIAELRSDLRNEHIAHRQTKRRLMRSECEVAELKEQLQAITRKAQDILDAATKDTNAAVSDRFLEATQKRFAAAS